jgi:hypothetical protein
MQNGKIRQAKIVLGDTVVKGVLPNATKIYIICLLMVLEFFDKMFIDGLFKNIKLIMCSAVVRIWN